MAKTGEAMVPYTVQGCVHVMGFACKLSMLDERMASPGLSLALGINGIHAACCEVRYGLNCRAPFFRRELR
jgi:hypothetical protein